VVGHAHVHVRRPCGPGVERRNACHGNHRRPAPSTLT
jgi:hypothetical protein